MKVRGNDIITQYLPSADTIVIGVGTAGAAATGLWASLGNQSVLLEMKMQVEARRKGDKENER